MRKSVIAVIVGLLLTGCARAETFETIGDELIIPASAVERQIILDVPEDASVMTMESNDGTIYLCDGYEITLETFSAGDLDRTVRRVTGYQKEDLTVLETKSDGFSRYDLVWTAAGEQGDRLGKAAILDDGSYHYVLSVMTDAEHGESLAKQWKDLFDSYGLA